MQADTVLYAEMTLSSQKVGILKKGQEASVWESNTIVRKPGTAKVTKVESQDLGLRVGDRIELVLYKGEGTWLIRHKGKEIELMKSKEASWVTIERPRTETWYKLGTTNMQGYTQDFPFEGCLE